MKTNKHFYDPPKVEAVTLQTNGFICQSEDIASAIALNQGYFDDFSESLDITIL